MDWVSFDKYCGIQGILSLLITITVIILVVLGKPIPPELWSLLGIGWGFYFSKNGTKIAQTLNDRLKKVK